MKLVWFRQDLRLADHPALHAALAGGGPVLGLYVLDEAAPGRWPLGGASRWWLHGSLAALAAAFTSRGSQLVLRSGRATDIIPQVAEETGASEIHTGVAHEPWWRDADAAIAKTLESAGRRLVRHRLSTLFEPWKITTKTGGIYGMYTPFARAVRAGPEPAQPLPAPKTLPGPDHTPHSEPLESWNLLPTHPDWAGGIRATWQPGEAGARARLKTFLARAVHAYDAGRNLPAEPGTSMLSPHLHWGEISPATVWHACRALPASAAIDTYLSELIWRDFSAYLLWHHRTLPDQALRPAFEALPYRRAARELAAWQRGRTGIPIVDAGMRQLWETGWMHNRVRMIVASFLTKHLLIDWRDGERWFWDTLVDADLASNGASWQWVAGTGIDAQPFFRVFNPLSQGEKFDPDGHYVRRFVPELAGLPARFIHAPWAAPAPILAAANITLGRTYPNPIVDLAEGRARALAAYRDTVRQGAPEAA